MKFLQTIHIVQLGKESVLQSTHEKVSNIKVKASPNELEKIMREPLQEDGDSLHDLLVNGLVELCKVKPVGLNSVEWLGEWLLSNNPNMPRVEIPDEE